MMNVFSAVESDLARRIRRTLRGGVRRMSTRSRILMAVALCATAAVSLPSTGIAQRGGDDSDTAVSERLDQVGRELRAAIERGEITPEQARKRYENARARIAGDSDGEGAGLGELQRAVIKAAMATPVAEWSDRLKAGIVRAGWDLEDFTEGMRLRQAVTEGRMTPEAAAAECEATANEGEAELRELQRAVIERAMAVPPEEWSDQLKTAIERADWDLDEFTEGIRQRQAAVAAGQSDDLPRFPAPTLIERASWGHVKSQARNPE
jgi:hypothetical protein